MPRVIRLEEGREVVLVLFAEDVAEQALPLVEELRTRSFKVVTEQELWKHAPIGSPAVRVMEEAVEQAHKVVVIPSPELLASDTSTAIMYMAIACKKAVPVILTSEVSLPLSLRVLSSADLTQEGNRRKREIERLVRSLM